MGGSGVLNREVVVSDWRYRGDWW